MNAASTTFIQDMLELGDFERKYKAQSHIDIKIARVNHYSSPTAQHLWRYQLEEIFSRADRSQDRMEDWMIKAKANLDFNQVEFKSITLAN